MFDATTKLADLDACDLICIPGGPGQTEAMQDQAFMAEVTAACVDGEISDGSLHRFAHSRRHGAYQRQARGFALGVSRLLNLFGVTPVAERVVRDGNVITGGGVTAASTSRSPSPRRSRASKLPK